MTRETFLKQIASLSDEQFARVSPFLEADLEVVDDLEDLRKDIAEARLNAASKPLLSAEEVYDRVRRKLSS